MSIEAKQKATVPLGAIVEPTTDYLGITVFPDIGICLGQEMLLNNKNWWYNNIFFLKSKIIMLMADHEIKILKEIK